MQHGRHRVLSQCTSIHTFAREETICIFADKKQSLHIRHTKRSTSAVENISNDRKKKKTIERRRAVINFSSEGKGISTFCKTLYDVCISKNKKIVSFASSSSRHIFRPIRKFRNILIFLHILICIIFLPREKCNARKDNYAKTATRGTRHHAREREEQKKRAREDRINVRVYSRANRPTGHDRDCIKVI